jgi:hypothetical protein
MTHEEFLEKYANLVEQENFIKIHFARGNMNLFNGQFCNNRQGSDLCTAFFF